MEQGFTGKEKRQWHLKKHIREHALEYAIEILGTVFLVFLLLKLCKAQEVALGVAFAFAWSFGRVVQQIHTYKKDYLDVENP